MRNLGRYLAEVVVGVLLGGVVMAALVGAAGANGADLPPWSVWASLLACILVAIVVGERLGKPRART